jgi:branched-chain amino acid transport system ATP-binding protein
MSALLEIDNVQSGYGEVQILWGVTLRMEEGRLTSLVGANGSGKTTLMRTVMGLIPTKLGMVKFGGQNVTRASPHARARAGMVMVPEGRQLFTDLSVLENLEMGATPSHARAELNRNLEWTFELFPRLKERTKQIAGTLSGGEQQMLAIGRGIMGEPKILMIDELSLGLAPLLVLQLFERLKQLKEMHITILLVEQNIKSALVISDYAYVISQGRIEMEGQSQQLAKNPQVRTAYLGL